MKKIIKKIHRRHALQILTYGCVGGGAWITQTIVYFMAISGHIFPSVAMILGNFAGMIVAYFGHVRFTFKRKHKFSHKEFVRFLATSIFGLCFNVIGVRVMTKIFLLDPHWAILPTIITPLLTFLISKFWAFK
ncbi:MAG: GtrA family protein [Burkholderiales bacterium]|nr:GtrA family protein [Burkholderiales bacterium]